MHSRLAPGRFIVELARVQRVGEAALVQLSDKAQIHQIFRLDRAGFRIFLADGSQDGLETVESRVLFTGELVVADITVVGSLHAILVAYLAEIFCRHLDAGLTIGLEAMDCFHMGLHIFRHGVRIFADKFTGRDSARVLKCQAQRSDIGEHGKAAFFWPMKLVGGLKTPPSTRFVVIAKKRSVFVPTCTRATSFSGVRPTLWRANRATKSETEPNLLMATEPPFNCAGTLISALPISHQSSVMVPPATKTGSLPAI